MGKNKYCLWPHELFSIIYHGYPQVWIARACPSVDTIREFWDAMVGNPQMDNADITAKPNLRSKCIPITIHGDGVPVSGLGKSWSKLIDVWHWTSLLGSGGTMDMCMYIFSVYQRSLSKVYGFKTYNWIQQNLLGAFANTNCHRAAHNELAPRLALRNKCWATRAKMAMVIHGMNILLYTREAVCTKEKQYEKLCIIL